MADMFNPQKRSEIMSKVHSKNTTPELKIRKLLFSMGYRFCIHRNDLPGKPDIVLPKYKTVIFINGCFWHGCPYCHHAKVRPQSNVDYWNKKLDRTVQRDKENYEKLEILGWKVLILWECSIKKINVNNSSFSLVTQIDKFIKDPKIIRCEL